MSVIGSVGDLRADSGNKVKTNSTRIHTNGSRKSRFDERLRFPLLSLMGADVT